VAEQFRHAPRYLREDGLGVGIELRAIRVLERMEDDRAGLVVCDSDGARGVAAPIVGPANIACEHVLRSLQPLEADHGRGANFGIAGRDSRLCEDVNFLACGSRLNTPAQSDATPWVRDLMVEQVRIESTYDIPCTRT
jgi:hypothetical protein